VQPLLTGHELAMQGLTLPRGRTDVPLRDYGTEVRISPTALSVDGAVLYPLESGRPADGAFTDGLSPALRATLAIPVDRAKQAAERTGRPWDRGLTLLVDRTIPFTTVADVMRTAILSEFSDFQIVVHDGRELRGLPVTVSRLWWPLHLEEELRERSLQLTFDVHADVVVAYVGERSGDGKRFPVPAGAAIGEYVAKLKKLFPHEVVARFRVDDDIPLQGVVSLIDTVSGVDCRLAGALRGEKIPDECLFWQPVLDREPPFIDPIHRR
jgi:hypothetical protein